MGFSVPVSVFERESSQGVHLNQLPVPVTMLQPAELLESARTLVAEVLTEEVRG